MFLPPSDGGYGLDSIAQALIRSLRQTRHRITVRRYAGTRAIAERLGRPIRVVHVTDQHVGRTTPERVQVAAVAAANAQSPDLVVLTGDYVCHSLRYLDQVESLAASFSAPVYAVLGNHDHWSGAAEVRRALERAGVTVLCNAWSEAEVGGERLQVVGIDDAYTGHADHRLALRGLRSDRASIGLSHIAEEAEHLWEGGVSLVFSGHTHSGQIALGGLHNLTIGALGGRRYAHGLYGCRLGVAAPGAVYVSAGIGAAVVGIRLGERARREIASFELGRLPGAFDEHHAEQLAIEPTVAAKPLAPEQRRAVARAKRVRRERWRERGRWLTGLAR